MRITATLFAAALVAVAPLVVGAQTRPAEDPHHPDKAQASPQHAPAGAQRGGMDTMGGDMGRMMAAMHGQTMGGMPVRHVEGRLAFLKVELKIASAQETAWNGFADAVRSAAKAMTPPMAHATGAPAMTPPDMLAHHEKALAARLERIRAMKGPLGALYATLDDAQKKTAAELLAGPMGMM